MNLSEISTGKSAIVVKVLGSGNFRRRIIEMGFVRGKKVEVLLNAPLNDPIKYKIMDYEVSLRRSEAALIEVISEEEAGKLDTGDIADNSEMSHEDCTDIKAIAHARGRTINIALVGNPNCGKTSLFNIASGAHEKVGNYSGVTVDAKEGHFDFEGYHFNIFDLPGTYSLSAYSPEEIYVRDHIFKTLPDVVVNIVAASTLERNLYLTTQLIDMDIPMVIALNMYDELEKSGAKLDYKTLGNLLGTPIVPTVASEGFNGDSGLKQLMKTVIDVYEQKDPTSHHIHINHRGDLQDAIDHINHLIKQADNYNVRVSPRFFAVKLLEKDKEAAEYVKTLSNAGEIFAYAEKTSRHIEEELGEDCESAIINAKYGFIAGALAETYTEGTKDGLKLTKAIDRLVTHKIWGYPIFLLFLWLTFECTFILGAYPQDWIDAGMSWLGDWIGSNMADGPLKELIVTGIIGGVGGVLVFVPQILILYFFISLMEDSGYLSRAAFIMDKIMHKMGLHGKSFVPMLMGFGCNVPAVMATRTLESRNNRLITMLVIPFMSCSARIPVYVLFAGAFFPGREATVMLCLYLLGIIAAVVSSLLFKKTIVKGEDLPFVMELPPYRMPTGKTVLHHMWEKSVQYLKKMGTIILFASIIIWALGYFPLGTNPEIGAKERLEGSYIGRFGQFIEPALKPLGFDWKMDVGIISGLPAKELVVSSLNVLYAGNDSDDDSSLRPVLQQEFNADKDPAHARLVAAAYLVFILLCFPCIATISAIKNESGSWKWALFSIAYTTCVAYVAALLIYQIGRLIL